MAQNKTMLKVVVIGNVGVGKTSLISQCASQVFPCTQFLARLSPDFTMKHLTVNNLQVTLQLWDPAGFERFRRMQKHWYRNTHCCVLVYDINNLESFENLQIWLEDCAQHSEMGRVPFILLGNNVDDGEKRLISPQQALDFCTKNGNIPYFETSAKDATNVKEAFELAGRLSLAHRDTLEKLAAQGQDQINLAPNSKKNSCW